MLFRKIDEYYKSKEYIDKLRTRAELMKQLEEDPLFRNEMVVNVWSIDPIRFIEDVLWLKIPNYNGAIKPMFLFEYQKKIIQALYDAENANQDVEHLIDKLREMGISWIVITYMYWRWLFTPNWGGFILSRTESEVDDGTDSPDSSLMGKIRFHIKHTPKWLLPQGYTPKGKKGTSTDSTLRILNPAIGSVLIGSSTNSNAGRSRRYSFIFIDECFFIERFSELWRALQSVARVKIFVSSVKQGRVSEEFKNLCERNGQYTSLGWQDHPWKGQEWYDEEVKKAEFDPEVMKELTVDYAVSVREQYYPQIRQATVETISYDRKLPVYCFTDFGSHDKTVIGFAQLVGGRINVVECVSSSLKEISWYAPFMNPDLPYNRELYTPKQIEKLNKVRSFRKPEGYFGEAAHFQRVMPLNTSIAQVLSKFSIRLVSNNNAIQHEPRYHATSLMLPKTTFNKDSDECMELYDAIANSKTATTIAPNLKNSGLKPKHDKYIADYRAAFENLAVNIPRVIKRQRDNFDVEKFGGAKFTQGIMKYLKV